MQAMIRRQWFVGFVVGKATEEAKKNVSPQKHLI
jgi:hypothetical protein